MLFDPASLASYPLSPGVYLMKDAKDRVLYIGKAKLIRNRLRQYFSGQDTRPQIPYLLPQIAAIDTIIVSSEKEALILENTLIKRHQPKYNTLLRDDKTYISLIINTKSKWPMLKIGRTKGKLKPGEVAFGPYPNSYAAKQTLELLQRLFPLRQCSDRELATRLRPCLLHQMKLCLGPCCDLVTQEEYARHVDRSIQFLKGRDTGILKDLNSQMQQASDELEFERAHTLLQTIRHLERTLEKQHVSASGDEDTDILGLYREADSVVLCQLLVRASRLIGSATFTFSGVLDDDAELLTSFIGQRYLEIDDKPKTLLLPVEPEMREQLEDWLHLGIAVPQRGDKLKLVDMAYQNAKAAFIREHDEEAKNEARLLELEEKLRLSHFPRRIECFDTSHLAASEIVATLVVFTDGKADKSEYRKYKVRTVDKGDDYAIMREVLTRRFSKVTELPNLLVIDGGKGHLNVALSVLKELDISTIDVIGFAKDDSKHTKSLTQDQIFLPGQKDALILRNNHPALFLLQQIRDEAHRTAITFNRSRFSKKSLSSKLDQIPGIGEAKQKALLKAFGSVKKMESLDVEVLSKVPGVSRKDAEKVKTALSQKL